MALFINNINMDDDGGILGYIYIYNMEVSINGGTSKWMVYKGTS